MLSTSGRPEGSAAGVVGSTDRARGQKRLSEPAGGQVGAQDRGRTTPTEEAEQQIVDGLLSIDTLPSGSAALEPSAFEALVQAELDGHASAEERALLEPFMTLLMNRKTIREVENYNE